MTLHVPRTEQARGLVLLLLLFEKFQRISMLMTLRDFFKKETHDDRTRKW